MSLHFLEDWILCLAGRVNSDGTTSQNRYAWPIPLPIRMAQCDKKFVVSASEAILQNIGLSDRQIMLGVKIVTKYKRQWVGLGVDPSYLLTDEIPLRLPIRTVSRDKIITKVGNTIQMKFPYNKELITELHQVKVNACGDWVWNSSDKIWSLSYTEGNIRLLAQLKHLNREIFSIDAEILDLMDRCHSDHMIPKLVMVDGKLEYLNAPPQAVTAVESFFGGPIKVQNALHGALVSDRFGFTIDETVTSTFSNIEKSFFRKSYDYGISNVCWDELFEFIQNNDQYKYVFAYRSHILRKVINRVTQHAGNRQNIVFRDNMDAEFVRTEHTIVITDIIMSVSNWHLNIASGALAMLYMIADDEKVNANNKINN